MDRRTARRLKHLASVGIDAMLITVAMVEIAFALVLLYATEGGHP